VGLISYLFDFLNFAQGPVDLLVLVFVIHAEALPSGIYTALINFTVGHIEDLLTGGAPSSS
jgi:hypothetical protein